MDYDIDDEFRAVPVAPVPPGAHVSDLAPDDDADDSFDPVTVASANAIRKYSPLAVMRALFQRQCPSIKLGANPAETLTSKQYVMYCTIIATFGTHLLVEEPLGTCTESDLDALRGADVATLKARLQIPKTNVTSTLTDGMLAKYALSIKGATVHAVEGGKHEVRVPGAPVPLIINPSGIGRGRVIKGGDDFVMWLNTVHQKGHAYIAVKPEAALHAFFLLAKYSMSVVKDKLVFREREFHASPVRKLFLGVLGSDIGNKCAEWLQALQKGAERAFSDPVNRPAIGSKANTVAYLEVLLHHYYSGASAATMAKLKELTENLNKLYYAAYAEMRSHIPQLFPDNKLFPEGSISVLKSGSFVMGEKGGASICSVLTHGNVGKFVADSRQTIRSAHDLPSKSDAPGLGYIGGTSSSVAQKITGAIASLCDQTGKAKFDDVDAWGTHTNNWWHNTIARAAKNIKFYDSNKSYAPPLGGHFEQANVEYIEPGTKRGKYVFDDTLTIPDKFAENDTLRVSEGKKVTAIINAKYAGGFIKLYYGSQDDAAQDIWKNPKAVEEIMESYRRVRLVAGGARHSPEYYIVFSHRVDETEPDAWLPPTLGPAVDGVRKYGKSSMGECTVEEAATARRRYVGTWMGLFALDVLRANMLLNLQVITGVQNFVPHVSYLEANAPVLYSSGTVVPSARVSERDLVAPDPRDLELAL